MTNSVRKSNYIEDPKIFKMKPNEEYQLKSNEVYFDKEVTNQRIRKPKDTKKIMRKRTKCSKNHEGNSPRYMHHVGFVFLYSVHKMESSLPSR